MFTMEPNFQSPATHQAQVASWAGASAPAMTQGDGKRSRWEQAIGKLYMMMSLEDDWDGQGAEAPSKEIVVGAIELAAELRFLDYPPPTRVAAAPCGTVGLEWQWPLVYLEVEVVSPYRSEWMLTEEGIPPVHGIVSRGPFIDLQMESMPSAYWVNSAARPTNRLTDFLGAGQGLRADIQSAGGSISAGHAVGRSQSGEQPVDCPAADFIEQTEYAWNEDFWAAEEAVRRYLKDPHADH